jgi:tripartite-type tricarboxylate transporter receptor subunit TctC
VLRFSIALSAVAIAGAKVMNLVRRRFLRLAGTSLAAPFVILPAWAQAYPARPVRLVVGFAPGSSADVVARVMGRWLSQRLGQQFIIENRPGAGTNIATEAVVRTPPDGYTLLMVLPSNAINATLYENLSFNFLRDIAPVASICTSPFVMEINPSVPAATIPEFVAYMKAQPGQISMASGGNGSGSHVSGELFKMMTGINMVHVPYRGDGPALTDLLAGQVQVMFGTVTSSIEHIRAGKLRALAVTSAARAEVLPDTPSVGEFVPGYAASGFNGLGAPKNTPAEIVDRLNREINAGLADPKIKARLFDLGGMLIPGTPEDFGKVVAEETDKWAKVIKTGGVALE